MPAREGPVYSPFRYDHLLTGIGTRRRNRTHVVGFGGRSSTIELDAHKKKSSPERIERPSWHLDAYPAVRRLGLPVLPLHYEDINFVGDAFYECLAHRISEGSFLCCLPTTTPLGRFTANWSA